MGLPSWGGRRAQDNDQSLKPKGACRSPAQGATFDCWKGWRRSKRALARLGQGSNTLYRNRGSREHINHDDEDMISMKHQSDDKNNKDSDNTDGLNIKADFNMDDVQTIYLCDDVDESIGKYMGREPPSHQIPSKSPYLKQSQIWRLNRDRASNANGNLVEIADAACSLPGNNGAGCE
ncbi:hypothetical protein N7451_012235 [Penicillium sp. IBT 35674x]|nr:hypothetical protein N7451_012235 [Penicillium sp. IBT 35674x]